MFIELTEALACPACLLRSGRPPPQGLVTVVRSLHERRVSSGHLGCPTCDARYPIRNGEIDFKLPDAAGIEAAGADEAAGAHDAAGSQDAAGAGTAAGVEEAGAVELAALLGLHPEARGYYLLAEGLAGLAVAVAGWARGAEFLVLAAENERLPGSGRATAPRETSDPDSGDDNGERSRRGGISVGRRVPPAVLPVLSRRYRGVALVGGRAAQVREAGRALAEGGRLAVLRPVPGARDVAERLSLEVLAAEERALVAIRR